MKKPDKRNERPARIELNSNRVYRISDPIQLSCCFYPQKNAYQKRAAFLAILFEIKNAPSQRLDTFEHIPLKHRLTPGTVSKVRAKMVRLGLIRRYQSQWIFSTVFCSTLEKLKEKVDLYQHPAASKDQLDLEAAYIQMAKGEESDKEKK